MQGFLTNTIASNRLRLERGPNLNARFVSIAICAIFAMSVGIAFSQEFPTKPVHMVVTFPPGGTLDSIARILVPQLSADLGQSVVVDNRPGATGVIGTEYVSHAPADGYTLLLIGPGFLINEAIRKKLPYDTTKDFAPVVRLATNPAMISVNPSVAATTLGELVALARAHPGQLSYASPGAGSSGHLAMEEFKAAAKIDIVHVPFQGGAPATLATVSSHTDILIGNVSEAEQLVAARTLRALAVTTLVRSEALPDVPTIAESGYPGFGTMIWFGAWVPSGTPKRIVDRLSGALLRALENPEVKDRFRRIGESVAPMDTLEFDRFIRSEKSRYAKIAKEVDLKID